MNWYENPSWFASRRRGVGVRMVVLTIAALIVLAISIHPIFVFSTTTHVTLTVNKTERVQDKGDSKYLIYCEGETLRCSDSFWYWKWNSSDQYGELKAGKKYVFKVYGWRMPYFSAYRNIVSFEETK